jgi:WD40 repeat protein
VGHTGAVRAAAFDAGGRSLLTAGDDHVVWLWDVERAIGRPLVASGRTPPQTLAVFLAPDGARALAVDEDATLRAWADDLPRDEAGLRAWLQAASTLDPGR